MERLRRFVLAGAVLGAVLVPQAASAAPQPKEPDCTWTNDNVAVCKFTNGTKVCYDHYGHKVECPSPAPDLGVALR